jgi:hypothetical protein
MKRLTRVYRQRKSFALTVHAQKMDKPVRWQGSVSILVLKMRAMYLKHSKAVRRPTTAQN